MTCFIEDEGEAVRVHDLVYARDSAGTWRLGKSSYRKLRLAPAWVAGQLCAAGYADVGVELGPRGMSVITARQPEPASS